MHCSQLAVDVHLAQWLFFKKKKKKTQIKVKNPSLFFFFTSCKKRNCFLRGSAQKDTPSKSSRNKSHTHSDTLGICLKSASSLICTISNSLTNCRSRKRTDTHSSLNWKGSTRNRNSRSCPYPCTKRNGIGSRGIYFKHKKQFTLNLHHQQLTVLPLMAFF